LDNSWGLQQPVNNTSIQTYSGFSYLKLFLALSRASHALLDIAAPCLAALLWLAAFPPLKIIVLGVATALSGYLSVYALNDVVDYRTDRKKLSEIGTKSSAFDLDALYIRHPMAQGLLSYKEGIIWAAAWGILALIGAYILNPMCALIFIISIKLEAVYCLMLQVTHLRALVSGMVKTMGPIAAVFAVDSQPSFAFLIVLFLWLFFWEIGGQNIPNDISDLTEDISLKAKTIPVTLGEQGARMLILGSLCAAVVMSIIILALKPQLLNVLSLAGAAGAGLYLLVLPAYHLYKSQDSANSARLFNRASYYPLAMLAVIAIDIIFVAG
jgi:4-hydroxybenzoate polyprenyltransferase